VPTPDTIIGPALAPSGIPAQREGMGHSWIAAGVWGLLAGSALLLGAAIGYFVRIPRRLIAFVMAFGAGVLISALSFELMDEAYQQGGFAAAAVGFVVGAGVYSLASWTLSRRGARHRKRSGSKQPTEGDAPGSGLAIAVGALLDGVPESIAIGLGLLAGGSAGMVTILAVFLSNVPEGLSSSAGMKRAGRSVGYVFGVWGGIALASSLASVAGFVFFGGLSAGIKAGISASAAGAILAMLTDTMVPEAFEEAHEVAGLLAVAGFLGAFTLSKVLGS
jgi:ZIP family zinc transporter